MKIPLIENYHTIKMTSRAYPLSKKDRDFLDEMNDKLHEQKRLEWVREACEFAHPVFIVWRRVNGENKGRMVVDLRQLNKASISDSYPLPLQADVIDSVRGKSWLTVIDATSFFF